MTKYGYMIATTTASNGTGTITLTADNTAVSGGSTAFTTQLTAQAVILCAGQILSVASITNDTALVLNIAASANATDQAFTYVNLTNVESLATPVYPPKSTYRPFTEAINLANGRMRGFGRPIASWRWGFITQAMRTQLRTFCTAKSNSIYIRTRTNEADAYSVFSTTVIWPDDEEKQAGRRLNYVLEFRNLVAL